MRSRKGWIACALVWAIARPAPGASLDEARTLHRAGEIDRALAAYAAVLETARTEDPTSAAVALNNSCLIRQSQGRLAEAIELCDEALVFRRQGDDLRGTARTLNNLGLALGGAGRYSEAEKRFLEALSINRERDDPESQAINLGNLAQLAIERGDYGAALVHLDGVDTTLTDHDEEPWSRRQRAYNRFNRAVLFEKMELYDEALTAYLEIDADELAPRDRATRALDLGVVYRNLGDPYLALDAFRESRELAERAGDGRGVRFAMLNAGIVLDRNLGDIESAREGYRATRAEAEAQGESDLALRARLYLAGLELADDPDAALAEFAAIAETADRLDFAELRWRARAGGARAAEATGDATRAKELYNQAIEVVEKVRAEVERRFEIDRLQSQARPVYRSAVDLHVLLGETETAYLLAQAAKRRYGAGAADGSDLATAAIRERLGEGTLLEYFVGERDLYRWTIRAEGVDFRTLGEYAPIARSIESLHAGLSSGRAPDPAALRAISETLLAGFERDELDGRLWIAPDGRLGYLPFELLPFDGKTLLETATVTWIPSGRALLGPPRAARTAPRRFAGFANPPVDSPAYPLAIRQRSERLGLGPLEGAEREVVRAAEALGGTVATFLGEGAAESALRRVAAEGADILHLGTHTLIEEGSGAEAAILLAPSDRDDGLLLPAEIAALDLSVGLTVLAGCRTAIGFDDRSTALSDLTGSFLTAGSEAVLATLWEVGDQSTEVFMSLFYEALRKGATPAQALRETKLRLLREPGWGAPHLWTPYVLVSGMDRPAISEPTGRVVAGRTVGTFGALALLALFAVWRFARASRA